MLAAGPFLDSLTEALGKIPEADQSSSEDSGTSNPQKLAALKLQEKIFQTGSDLKDRPVMCSTADKDCGHNREIVQDKL